MMFFLLFLILILILTFVISKNNKILPKFGGNKILPKFGSNKILSKFGGNKILSKFGDNKIHKNFTKSINKYYYSIYNGDMGLMYSELDNILAKYNFYPQPLTKYVHVSLGSASGVDIHGKINCDNNNIVNGKPHVWSPLFLQQKAVIKNTLKGYKFLEEKVKLYKTIKKLMYTGIKYVPKTYTILEFEQAFLKKGFTQKQALLKIFILKKNKTGQQKGVSVFTEQKDYLKIKKELNINPHNAIIMEYITNPALTIDGKKFHLRIYALLIIESGIKRCYIYDNYWILTAEEPYKKGDWLNKKIHITGASSTMRSYKYPDDIAKPLNEKKFNEFKKTLAMIIALNKYIIFEENNIGYHMYGIDVLVTDDDHFLILEINGHALGHNCVIGIKNTPECDIFRKQFSRDYFSFILNCTVFSVFGIKERPVPLAEVCDNGVLSPFFNILTGDNRWVLIPYLDMLENKIEEIAKSDMSLSELIKKCYLDNIFLISKPFKKGFTQNHNKPFKKGFTQNHNKPFKKGFTQNHNNTGYLGLDKNNYLTIIMKEYENKETIVAAMVAQFLEIYSHRHFATNENIYMIKSQLNDSIAKQLNFTIQKNVYLRTCRI